MNKILTNTRLHVVMPKIQNLKSLSKPTPQLSTYGETPLPFSPQISLSGGPKVVPQQYLNVERNLSNIETILERIDFSDDYLLFAHQESGVLSIQVGILGCENYPFNQRQETETKIVYGRRWLIEPTTPTSEIVQTALLAIKKSREHELRENVLLLLNDQYKTTPFNSHMDLPLMKSNPDFFYRGDRKGLGTEQELYARTRVILESVKLKSFEMQLDSVRLLNEEKALIELSVTALKQHVHFPELNDQRIAFICDDFNESVFLHELMNELIKRSDRYIEEHFTFDGFARFSHKVCPKQLAEFSYQTRNIKHKDPRFHQHFRQMSYDVDASKAPFYAGGALGEKQRDMIERKKVAGGYLPNEIEADEQKKMA